MSPEQPSVDVSASQGQMAAGTLLDGRYEVIRPLGEGAMGAVYEVRHRRLGKRFAIKVIRQSLSTTPLFVERFEREALSTSRLAHQNCVTVTDYGKTSDGALYMVMEYLEGSSLEARLATGVSTDEALHITRQILRGLAHAHQAGVVHRDIKPDNVMLAQGGGATVIAKVVDFGIAKLRAQEATSTDLTQVGTVAGTPAYMAPEQAIAFSEVDARADLYAVGAILWNMLTGRDPFEDADPVRLLATKIKTPAPRLSDAAPGRFDHRLDDVLARALAREPADRFASAEAFLDALESIDATAPDASGAASALRSVVANWYWCAGAPGPPTWRRRATRLATTVEGRIVAAGLGLLLALIAVVVVALVASGDARLDADDDVDIDAILADTAPSAATTPRAPAVLAKATALDDVTLRRARKLLEDKKCREASLAAQNTVARRPSDAEAHYLLGAAMFCRRRYDEALAGYRRAIALAPRFRGDARIGEDIEALLGRRRVRGAALDFLERSIGTAGLAVLLRATTHAHRSVRQRAVAAVTRLGAADQIDRVRSLSLDLAQVSSCKRRREIVERLRATNDSRAIRVLRRARDRQAGFFGGYHHRCVRREIIAALTALSKSP